MYLEQLVKQAGSGSEWHKNENKERPQLNIDYYDLGDDKIVEEKTTLTGQTWMVSGRMNHLKTQDTVLQLTAQSQTGSSNIV